ncbi:hypothetical protein BFL36_02610 [Clavibacter michiganensis]|uniref:Uncharacterized protein n=1 Tax=Clavibacter michiganensis TaxID=28447 RepID=A0A251YVK7_9MICO|nr:hypothetical protein [Clavibacter michiganensis]OUE28108.1 hypothetical protein BFL36_02610 [Clavibacter michiganensis]
MSISSRRRALRDAVVLTAFFVVSQLVVVPLVSGGTATERLEPTLIFGVPLFVAAYLIRRTAGRRRRDG